MHETSKTSNMLAHSLYSNRHLQENLNFYNFFHVKLIHEHFKLFRLYSQYHKTNKTTIISFAFR